MKRVVVLILVCTIPALLFLNAWQVFRFSEQLAKIRELEVKQRELIEDNKKTLVGIEVLSSPSRIDEIVGEMGGVEKRTNVDRVLIRVGAQEGEGR